MSSRIKRPGQAETYLNRENERRARVNMNRKVRGEGLTPEKNEGLMFLCERKATERVFKRMRSQRGSSFF